MPFSISEGAGFIALLGVALLNRVLMSTVIKFCEQGGARDALIGRGAYVDK